MKTVFVITDSDVYEMGRWACATEAHLERLNRQFRRILSATRKGLRELRRELRAFIPDSTTAKERVGYLDRLAAQQDASREATMDLHRRV